MTEQEKIRLEKNLTRSANKAKPGWVRAIIGQNGPEDQGFVDPRLLIVAEPNDLTLAQFYEETQIKFTNLNDELIQLNNQIEILQQEITKLHNINKNLESRLRDLEGFQLD